MRKKLQRTCSVATSLAVRSDCLRSCPPSVTVDVPLLMQPSHLLPLRPRGQGHLSLPKAKGYHSSDGLLAAVALCCLCGLQD